MADGTNATRDTIRVVLNYFFCAWRTPGVRLSAPHVRLMCTRLGTDGYLRFSLVS
jgi:hypothetical protein